MGKNIVMAVEKSCTGERTKLKARDRGVHHDLLKLREERIKKGVCVNCGKPLDQIRPIRKRYYCSSNCANEWWAKTNWASFRIQILERDNYTCTECGRTAKELAKMNRRLEVHHNKPVRLGKRLTDTGAEFDPENCRTVCNVCHKRLTRRQYRAASLKKQFGPVHQITEYLKIKERLN